MDDACELVVEATKRLALLQTDAEQRFVRTVGPHIVTKTCFLLVGERTVIGGASKADRRQEAIIGTTVLKTRDDLVAFGVIAWENFECRLIDIVLKLAKK